MCSPDSKEVSSTETRGRGGEQDAAVERRRRWEEARGVRDAGEGFRKGEETGFWSVAGVNKAAMGGFCGGREVGLSRIRLNHIEPISRGTIAVNQ